MNCAEFETMLFELLGGESRPGDDRLHALSRHAAGCPQCRGSEDLVALLGLPVDARDTVGDPPRGYWDEFQDRLSKRIRAKQGDRRSARRRLLAAVAAVAVLGIAAMWVAGLFAPSPPGSVVAVTPEPVVVEELPAALEKALMQSPRAEVIDELAIYPIGPAESGAFAPNGETDLFLPDVSDLDDETQEKLLDWLREQNAASGGLTS